MNGNRISLATAVALSGLMLACGPKGPTDEQLTTDIQAKLYANDATRAANVNVAVKEGIVTLSGDVPNSDVELQAIKIANSATGIKTVTDQMKRNDAFAANSLPDAANVPASIQLQPAHKPKAAPQPPAQNSSPAPTEAVPPPPVQTSSPQSQVAQVPLPQYAPPPMPPPQQPMAPPRREPVTVTIPVGERLAIRMIDGIDTKTNTEGQTFRASLDAPLTSDGRVIVPVGAPVTVLLASAKGAGRIKGQSSVEVRVTSLRYQGHDVPVNSSVFEEQGKARGKQSAIRTGLGAAAGALIGGLAGGGKGAAIGSVAGGGAGAGVQLATHGQQVKIPAETPLSFRLEAPLTFEVKR